MKGSSKMALVFLTRTDGQEIAVDPSEVFTLEPVPAGLVDEQFSPATYINDGKSVSVVGTVAEVAAKLDPAPPPPGPTFGPSSATIVVGNVPAGDPTQGQPGAFGYIPDQGDGNGIREALEAVTAEGGGLVHIRRGVYDFGLVSSPALPLTIRGLRVQGDGCSTVLRMSTTDRRLFVLETGGPDGFNGAAPELVNIGIDWTVAAPGAVGTELLDAAGGAEVSARAVLQNIDIQKNLGGAFVGPILNPEESLTSIIRTGFGTQLSDCNVFNVDGTANLTVVVIRLSTGSAVVSKVVVIGGNVSFRLESFGARLHESVGTGGVLFGSFTGVEIAANGVIVEANTLAAAKDGIVVLSGEASRIIGNAFSSFLVGDGIRVEAAATDTIVTSNAMNGTPLVILSDTTESAHNVL